MGHQDSFLAPLPGSVALLVSGIGKETFRRKCYFISVCLFSFIMESFTAGYMFGNGSSTTRVVERSSPITEIVPFEISTGIVDHVMDNRYARDGTVHPGEHLLYIKELCGLFKIAGVPRE